LRCNRCNIRYNPYTNNSVLGITILKEQMKMKRYFSVKFKYEKNRATRKGNTKRLQTVKQRLIDSGIKFENRGFFFSASEIPNNIKRLIDIDD
jgi:hypothetical protein